MTPKIALLLPVILALSACSAINLKRTPSFTLAIPKAFDQKVELKRYGTGDYLWNSPPYVKKADYPQTQYVGAWGPQKSPSRRDHAWSISAQRAPQSRIAATTRQRCPHRRPSKCEFSTLNHESERDGTARFVCKMALEILAFRCKNEPGWNEEIVEKMELDDIRSYVRRGRPNFVWPLHMRRIYPAHRAFLDGNNPEFRVLNEFDLLLVPTAEIPGAEVYAIIAIFGVEYVVNLGGPELDGYVRWLKNNDGKSYLYSGKNAQEHFEGL